MNTIPAGINHVIWRPIKNFSSVVSDAFRSETFWQRSYNELDHCRTRVVEFPIAVVEGRCVMSECPCKPTLENTSTYQGIKNHAHTCSSKICLCLNRIIPCASAQKCWLRNFMPSWVNLASSVSSFRDREIGFLMCCGSHWWNCTLHWQSFGRTPWTGWGW